MTEIGTALPKGPTTRSLRAMVVDDESVIRGPLALCLETLGHHVVEAATVEEAIAHASSQPLDFALVDLRLGTASGLDLMTQLLAIHPRLKIIIITAFGSVDVAVRAMARGATDFLCKPFTPDQLAAAVARASFLRDLETDVGIMPDRLGTAGPEADFATTSAALQDAILTVRRVAPTSTPILISGSPGVGKGVLARAIHGWGRHPDGPFVSIDCSTRSMAYVDLALFGDTLAGQQIVTTQDTPLLIKATGGTLLIKRIEMLSPRSQERLAHALETHLFETPERHQQIPCDFRLLATTLDAAALSPQLRMLLERIQVTLPSLRERSDDIPMLAQRYLAFARQTGEKQVLGFSVNAIDRLLAYEWPDNLRELHRVVDQAYNAADVVYIEPRHLNIPSPINQPRRRPAAGDSITLQDLEVAHIREVLATKKSLQEAAETLGIDLQALYRRRKQYGIE